MTPKRLAANRANLANIAKANAKRREIKKLRERRRNIAPAKAGFYGKTGFGVDFSVAKVLQYSHLDKRGGLT